MRATTAGSDSDLFRRAREGDRSAFGCLVDRHKNGLVNYLTRLCGDRDCAEDLAQEAFLRLYERGGNYSEQGKLQAYLYRIATNVLRSQARRNQRWLRLRPLFFHPDGHHLEPAQQSELLHDELSRQLAKALLQLPMRYRAPLVLAYVEGRSHREIATVLGCQEGTVKSRIHRGCKMLRHHLEAYQAGGRS